MRVQASISIIAVAASLASGGCAPTVQLAVEPAVLSPDWSAAVLQLAPVDTARAEAPTLAALFGSPELAKLTQQALDANPNLRAAQARTEQAIAGLRIARGASLPVVSISAGARASRSSNAGPFEFSTSFAAIDALLSIDISGEKAAGRRTAAQRVRAAGYDRDALSLAISADLARIFVQRAALAARIELVDRNLVATTKLQKILEIRQREGVATRVDVGLQIIRVKELEAERNRLHQALDQTRTALAVLAGEEAPRFVSRPAALDRFVLADLNIPNPSALIAVRPDIMAAEARVRAAGGDVAQARAAFLPRLDISLSRAAQGILGGGPLAGVVLGADILLPIFGRHRLTGELDLATAVQRESVEAYRQVLLVALADVEDALSAVGHARARSAILADIDREATLTADLAQRQYLEGDADLRAVFDAQDLLIRAQDARAVSIQEQLEASIALYRTTRRSGG